MIERVKNLSTGTLKVKYGMHQIGRQIPYFSITAEEREDGQVICCGCMHDRIAQVFPELTPLIRWHLTDQTGLPMHYFANATYWFETGNIENFKSTVVFGALLSDKVPTPETLQQFLTNRLPLLMEAFVCDMERFNVDFIKV